MILLQVETHKSPRKHGSISRTTDTVSKCNHPIFSEGEKLLARCMQTMRIIRFGRFTGVSHYYITFTCYDASHSWNLHNMLY